MNVVCTRQCCSGSPKTRMLGPQGLGRGNSGTGAADPQSEIKTGSMWRAESLKGFPSSSTLFSGKKSHNKENVGSNTEEHSTKWVSSALPRRCLSGHGWRHEKVFLGQELHKHTLTPLLTSHPPQLHCTVKPCPESKLHPKTSPGASSPARIAAPRIPHGSQGQCCCCC